MGIKVLSSGKSLLGDDDSILNASVRAALLALNKGGLSAKHIDCIVCTSSFFRPSSFTAKNVKRHLGIFSDSCATKDEHATVYSLPQLIECVRAEIEAGIYERVLLICNDGSRMRLNWSCIENIPVIGEMAWALVIGKETEDSFFSFSREEKMEVCT